jgi:hypothetical protein
MNQLWREQPNKTYRWQSKNSKRTAYFRSKKDALEYSHFALNNLEFDLVGNLFESLKETPFSKQLQAGDTYIVHRLSDRELQSTKTKEDVCQSLT